MDVAKPVREMESRDVRERRRERGEGEDSFKGANLSSRLVSDFQRSAPWRGTVRSATLGPARACRIVTNKHRPMPPFRLEHRVNMSACFPTQLANTYALMVLNAIERRPRFRRATRDGRSTLGARCCGTRGHVSALQRASRAGLCCRLVVV